MPFRQKIIFSFIFVFCLFFLVLPSIRSGILYRYGYGFWGPNGHDGIWHLSLINHITNPWSIPIPGFSGEMLNNYHPFFDILLGLIHHFTHLPASILLFQIFPLVVGTVFLIVSFRLGKTITHDFYGGIFLMFTNTFSTSFGWVVTLIRDGRFAGESLFWSMQSPSTFLNPPFALSLLFMLVLITLLLKDEKLSSKDYCLIFFILILSPITKAYSTVAIFTLFGLYTIYQFNLGYRRPIVFFAVTALVSLFVFRFYNPATSGVIKWQPFWIVAGMFESSDRFLIPKVSSAIFNLSQSSPHSLKLLLIYLIGSIIFIIGNFGFRVIGFLQILNFKLKPVFRHIIFAMVFTTIIPLFFVQSGTGWNIVQFLYYGLFLANILFISQIFSHPSKKVVLVTLVIISTLNFVANYENIKNYLGNPAPASLPPSEVKALSFLNQQPSGVVLTFPFDGEFRQNMSTPIPLYAYETNSYVSAYTHHLVYLSDEMNLNNSQYPWQLRRDNEIRFFEQKAVFENRGFLLNNRIDYIYLTGRQLEKTVLDKEKLYLEIIYNDGQTLIYKVLK